MNVGWCTKIRNTHIQNAISLLFRSLLFIPYGVDIISVSSSSATYELGTYVPSRTFIWEGGKDFDAQTVMALDELDREISWA